MSKKISRKHFIKFSAILGTSMLLANCGVSENTDETKNLSTDTVLKKITTPIQKPSFDLVTKENSRYNGLRKGFNKSIDKYPAAIALCTNTKDVAEAISYANKNNLEIAIKAEVTMWKGFRLMMAEWLLIFQI